MRVSTAAAAWLGIAIGFACTGNPLFLCHESSDCIENGVDGTCQPGGLCSFPDDDCTTGQRYGNHAGNVSGECVPNVDETGGETTTATTASSATSTTNASATSTPVAEGTSTGEPDDTTLGPDPMTSTSSVASTGEGSTTGDTSAETDSGGMTSTADPYGLCDDMTPCPQDWQCVDFTGMGNMACIRDCGMMGMGLACPPHPDGLDVTCYSEMGLNVCLIPCGSGMMQMCPAGFMCFDDMSLMMPVCIPS